MISSNFDKEIIEHATSLSSQEVCGFVLYDYERGAYIEKSFNTSQDITSSFSINPSEYLKYKTSGKLLGIYHSHPFSDEKPSKSDIKNSEELGAPYLIYSNQTKKFFLSYPSTYEPVDYLGRPHIKGFFECTSLARDYYKKEKGLDFYNWVDNHWPPGDYRDTNEKLINLLTTKGRRVDISYISKGDVILFAVAKRMHCGIYIGGDEFIHQLVGKFSSQEMLDDRYRKFIKGIYRYDENDVLSN